MGTNKSAARGLTPDEVGSCGGRSQHPAALGTVSVICVDGSCAGTVPTPCVNKASKDARQLSPFALDLSLLCSVSN